VAPREDGRVQIRSSKPTQGPVPGTVEIESQYEVDTSAAVPGTDMQVILSNIVALCLACMIRHNFEPWFS